MIDSKVIKKFKKDLKIVLNNFQVTKNLRIEDIDVLESMVIWWFLSVRQEKLLCVKSIVFDVDPLIRDDEVKIDKDDLETIDNLFSELGMVLNHAPFEQGTKELKKVVVTRKYSIVLKAVLSFVDGEMDLFRWYDELYMKSLSLNNEVMEFMSSRSDIPPEFESVWNDTLNDWKTFSVKKELDINSFNKFLECFVLKPKLKYLSASSKEIWEEIESKIESIKMLIDKFVDDFSKAKKIFLMTNTALQQTAFASDNEQLLNKNKRVLN